MGKWVTFHPDPSKIVACMPVEDAARYAGEVVGMNPVEPFGKGKIPDVGLLVRGVTGKKLRISVVEHYVEIHPSKSHALSQITRTPLHKI